MALFVYRSMLGRRLSGLAASGQVRRRVDCLLRSGPGRQAVPGFVGQLLARRCYKVLASDSIPEVNKSYTVKVGSIPQLIARTLNKGDIIKLFGAFEPFNIEIHKEEPKEKGGEPVVTATFQVPSLGYVRDIVESFQEDQTWGEKITVSQDTKMFPVFMENLPQLTSEELKTLLVKAMAAPSKLNPAGTKGDGPLKNTHVDAYNGYAMIRCPTQFISMAVMQGQFAKGSKNKASTEPLIEDSEDLQEACMAADTNFEDEDGSWHNILRTYPAWRGFSVRVNNIPLDMTPEQLAHAFGGAMPYDLEMLPPVPGMQTRSAYLRFARRSLAEHCVKDWNAAQEVLKDRVVRDALQAAEESRGGGQEGVKQALLRALEGKNLIAVQDILELDGTPPQVASNLAELLADLLPNAALKARSAHEPLCPVLVEVPAAQKEAAPQLFAKLSGYEATLVDGDIVDLGDGKVGLWLRYATPDDARAGLERIRTSEGLKAELAWKDFTLTLTQLPAEFDDHQLHRLLGSTNPYEVVWEAVEGSDKKRAKVSFFSKTEAERFSANMAVSGMDEVNIRKSWLVYRLRVTELPKDVTEADIMEGLKGHEPYQVDILMSRKGRPKGEAVLRFDAYDKMLGAVAKLSGRDSLMDEAINDSRWETRSWDQEADRLFSTPEFSSKLAEWEDDPEVQRAYEEIEPSEEAQAIMIARMTRHARDENGNKIKAAAGEDGEDWDGDNEDEEEDDMEEEEGEEGDSDEEDYEMHGVGDEEEGEEERGSVFREEPEGSWVKMIIDQDTVQTTLPGGRVMSYRMLVVVGNLRGAAGWGVGKGETPEEAKIRAFRDARKNLIHLDLFRGRCVTMPLYGKHNACRIYIQAGNPRRPNMEGRMVNDIIRCFGIECGEAKSIGKRNPYSLVRAIFDALSKHQGVEEIARKRGRRLITMSKARYMGL